MCIRDSRLTSETSRRIPKTGIVKKSFHFKEDGFAPFIAFTASLKSEKRTRLEEKAGKPSI
eukprot:3340408-Amphidinium_carterae.1